MSISATKYQSNRDVVGDNQTLFDFLKRKKKHNLQNTVNKSLHHHSYTKKKMDLDLDDDFPQQENRTKNTYEYQSTKQAPRRAKQSITPKKIDFEDRQEPINANREPTPNKTAGHPQGKSFLALISPLKHRANSALEENKCDKQNVQNSNKVRSSKKVDVFCKKKVTGCINTLKQKFAYYNSHLRSFKQKTHGLVVLFNPIFSYILESNNPYTKQVGDLKNKLRSFESLISSIDIDSDDIIQQFHKNLQQHMKFEQGSMKKIYQSAKNEQIQSFKNKKQTILNNLQLEHKKLIKQNELLLKKLQKFQKNQSSIEQNVQQRQMNHVQTIQRLKGTYQNTIQQLRQEVDQLKGELKQMALNLKDKDKDIKNERMLRESAQVKARKQIQQIIEVKDAYLLNQIMVLKTQFNADITKISQFSRIKEAELIDKLAQRDEQINKIRFQKGCDRHIESKIIQQANIIKRQNLQLKSKADCIITDMYRMNEELYQHWIALKDIKGLSTRLGCFNQYKKIYEDLLFNDNLFH